MNKQINLDLSIYDLVKEHPELEESEVTEENRTRIIKSYLKRLGAGEDLESVKADFVTNFKDVDASEIMKAEKEVVMAGVHMTVEQLSALFNTIPMEITFVDADNMNRFFNEGAKDFKRPQMAIDREVFSCHPPKVEAKVRQIIGEFIAGTLDELPIWMEKNGKCMLVKYMAVRDKDNNYLGTVEFVQNMDFAKEHFLSKNQSVGE